MHAKNNFDSMPADFDFVVQTIATAICVRCDWEEPALHGGHALTLWEDHECEYYAR